jgi:hypothetical protein
MSKRKTASTNLETETMDPVNDASVNDASVNDASVNDDSNLETETVNNPAFVEVQAEPEDSDTLTGDDFVAPDEEDIDSESEDDFIPDEEDAEDNDDVPDAVKRFEYNTVAKQMSADDPVKNLNQRSDASKNVVMVPFKNIVVDRDFNIRNKAEAYLPENLEDMKNDIVQNGLDKPLVVSRDPAYNRANKDKDLVLQGNRRMTNIASIRIDYLQKHNQKPELYPLENMPFEKVPCVVHTGLTYAEEVSKMLDHGQVKGLTELEFVNAVERLIQTGHSQAQITVRLAGDKTKRGQIQKHYEALSMGKEIAETYKRYKAGDKTVPVMSAPVITALWKAQNEDKKSGKIQFGGGPALRAAWEKVQNEELVTQTERKKGIQRIVETEIKSNVYHSVLGKYLEYILNGDNPNGLNDSRTMIERALEAMYPERQVVEKTV